MYSQRKYLTAVCSETELYFTLTNSKFSVSQNSAGVFIRQHRNEFVRKRREINFARRIAAVDGAEHSLFCCMLAESASP